MNTLLSLVQLFSNLYSFWILRYLSMLITDKHGISITADSPFENGKLVLCVQSTFEV